MLPLFILSRSRNLNTFFLGTPFVIRVLCTALLDDDNLIVINGILTKKGGAGNVTAIPKDATTAILAQ
jgi:hypothetical protein